MDFPPEDQPPLPTKETPSPWLRGSSIYVGFDDLGGVWLELLDVWRTARIGMKATDTGPLKYGPNAVAKGSDLDAGLRIPAHALRTKGAFLRWARQNGYEDGMSVLIDGMVAAPGRSVISGASSKRKGDS
jgi:hypothetical protein